MPGAEQRLDAAAGEVVAADAPNVTIPPSSAAQTAQSKRFVYRAASALAAVFVIGVALVQLQLHGARGLEDASFVGFEIAVGLIAFRSGMVVARGYETLSRSRRERRGTHS